jgi:hypothetical protein
MLIFPDGEHLHPEGVAETATYGQVHTALEEMGEVLERGGKDATEHPPSYPFYLHRQIF